MKIFNKCVRLVTEELRQEINNLFLLEFKYFHPVIFISHLINFSPYICIIIQNKEWKFSKCHLSSIKQLNKKLTLEFQRRWVSNYHTHLVTFVITYDEFMIICALCDVISLCQLTTDRCLFSIATPSVHNPFFQLGGLEPPLTLGAGDLA